MSLTFLREMSYGLNYTAWVVTLRAFSAISPIARYELDIILSWWSDDVVV